PALQGHRARDRLSALPRRRTRRTQLGKTQFRVSEASEGTREKAQKRREDEAQARKECTPRDGRPAARTRKQRARLSAVEGTHDAATAAVEYVSVDHRRRDIRVAEQ